MKPNKAKGAIIYLIVIAVLFFGLIGILKFVSPMMNESEKQDDSVVRNPTKQVQVMT
ncbi:MAG: hypothetical protein IJX15_06110 [Ruminiclostridium sp.]|nr:hypothetical protein [Ruminiclostridium sp.]